MRQSVTAAVKTLMTLFEPEREHRAILPACVAGWNERTEVKTSLNTTRQGAFANRLTRRAVTNSLGGCVLSS